MITAATRMLGISLVSCVASFGSTIVFSNLVQPGSLYGPDALGFGHTPAFTDATGVVSVATRFTPSGNYRLADVELPLGAPFGPGPISVFLMSDAGGVPGQILESYNISNLPAAGPNGFPLTTFASTSKPLLVSGTQYWVAATSSPPTFALWTLTLFQGDTTAGNAYRIIDNGIDQGWIGSPGTRTGALVVEGDPVPETESFALVAAGLILVAASKRRK